MPENCKVREVRRGDRLRLSKFPAIRILLERTSRTKYPTSWPHYRPLLTLALLSKNNPVYYSLLSISSQVQTVPVKRSVDVVIVHEVMIKTFRLTGR